VSVLIDKFDVFAGGFWLTLQICVLAAIGALILGAVVAVLRISPVPPLRAVGTGYVTVFRNMPLTVVMFFAAFGLPALGSNADFLRIPVIDSLFRRLGTDLPYFRFALGALVLYTAAFVCEALRSGVNAVPPGQNLRYVVLPQSWKASVVPLGSVIIAMIKNSALIGFFGVVGDLSQTADQLTSAEGYAFVPVAIGVSIGYLIMTVPLGVLLDRVEKRQAVTSR